MRAFCVEDRTADVLIPIIRNNVYLDRHNPCRVYSDSWSAYSSLSEVGYDHRNINHTAGFGWGTETTNHIESMWAQLKREGRFNRGFSSETFENVQIRLNETLSRIENKENDSIFNDLIRIITTHMRPIFE